MPFKIPESLKKRLADGKVILFVGAAMSRPTAPGWPDLLEKLIKEGKAELAPGILKEEQALRDKIGKKELLEAAQLLRTAMGRGNFGKALKQAFQVKGDERHQIVSRLPLAAILTTNFDHCIEEALPAEKRARVLRQTQTAELIQAVSDGEFAVVHLHGDIGDMNSIVLTADDYKAVKLDEGLAHFIHTFFTTHTFLFVGYGLADDDLLLFLSQAFTKTQGYNGSHFALEHAALLSDDKRAEFDTKYGIRFIEDDRAGFEYPDILAFLRELEALVPVPPEVESDVAALFDEAGYRRLEKLENQPGRLVYEAELRGGVDDIHAAIGYVHREPREADFEAVRVEGKEVCHLVCLRKPTAAIHPGVKLWSRDEFLARMMPVDSYKQKIRTAHENPEGEQIERYYVPLRVKQGRKEKGPVLDLDEFLDGWLRDDSGLRKHLSILGEFGTGKSWFTKHLCYRAACRQGRIPILLQLSKFGERFDVRSLVTDALMNEHGLNVGDRVFRRLNQEGRLLVIFDGFDEMVRDANNPGTAKDNFDALAELAEVAPRAKIVLTCRTEFFATEKDQDETLRVKTEAWLKGRKGFECVHLQLFDDGQVEDALEKQGLDGLFKQLKGMSSLFEFARRPVLLQMVLETKDEWVGQSNFTMAALYERYTERMIQRRPSANIAAADRRLLIDEAAWRIQSQQNGLKSKAFDEMVEQHFQKADLKERAKRVIDLQSQASYFRREGDIFNFAHKSFREYFVAKQLAGQLRAGKVSDLNLPLTDVITEFVAEMLQSVTQEVKETGAMVKVPAGPFIYGNEEEKNLRLAETTEDYWIDKNPVTNEQFLGFLKDKGVQKKWINHGGSMIGSDLKIAPGYEQHPVTGVTWHGADAYATSVKGRRLPTEMEWEKAARGFDGRLYPWVGPFSKDLCNISESGPEGTSEVGKYPKGASPYGALDMAGNVWEWTSSDWAPGGDLKVLRGGAWDSDSGNVRCAYRLLNDLGIRFSAVGFRCART